MSSRQFLLSGVALPIRLRWLVLGWIGAEIVTFMLLVRAIGLGATLLLGLAATVLGIVLLRRLGTDALSRLRRPVEPGAAADGPLLDGLLAALGAVLLILPGFLANAVGLALSAPSARRGLALRFGAGQGPRVRRPSRPEVIDLGPDDWTPVDRA